jgi:hypothetical protein
MAVGSTAGSDDDPHFVPLNWDEFSRDLRVANHFSQTIGVYNLDGCVRQGFLPRLKTVNWSEPVDISREAVRQAMRFRVRIQRALWIGDHLAYFVALVLIGLTWMVASCRKRGRLRMQRQA